MHKSNKEAAMLDKKARIDKQTIWTMEHVEFYDTYRKIGMSISDISAMMRDSFEGFENKTDDAIRKAYSKFKVLLDKDVSNTDMDQLDAIKARFTTRIANSKLTRENKLVVEELLTQDQLLKAIQMLLKQDLKPVKVKTHVNKIDSKKENMTYLTLLSDIHNGKLIEKHNVDNTTVEIFNNEIFNKRVDELVRVTISAIKQDQKFFNVEKVVVAMLGDFIENSIMHGVESAIGSEYANSEQIMNCIKCLYTNYILKLAELGIPLEFACVTGNHDRITEHKTYNAPGKTNSTWVIYNTLKMLCDASGLKTKWIIATDSFLLLPIYNKYMLLEHGDEFKNLSEQSFINAVKRREMQTGVIISFARCGHFHAPMVFGNGKFICNGSLTGQDDYALNKGYSTIGGQYIESFIDCKNRDIYFRNLFIQTDHIK